MIDINKHDLSNDSFLKSSSAPHIAKDILAVFKKLSVDVSENPANLKRHTQRVLFCADNSLGELACASLQDLFIVLQENGRDLRLQLVNLVSPLIEQDDRHFFQQWLSDESDRNLKCRNFAGSVFFSKNCQSNHQS